MKNLLMTLVLAMSFVGCTSSTVHGPCIGLISQDERDPELHYKYSIVNIVLAVVFSETLVVPLIVILDNLECPVGVRP